MAKNTKTTDVGKKVTKKTPAKKKAPVKAKAKAPVKAKAKAPVKPKSGPEVKGTTKKIDPSFVPQSKETKEHGVVVLITGGFDPLHSGHLEYIEAAKELGKNDSWFGSKVIVGVNSDEWLTRKKGKAFMPVEERVRLLLAMRNVDQVITFNDDDDSSSNAIHITRQLFPNILSLLMVETEHYLTSKKWVLKIKTCHLYLE